MYSQSIHLTHELKLCIKIPRGRVDFLTKIPKLKVLAGTEFLTLKKLVKCMHTTELQNVAFLCAPHQLSKKILIECSITTFNGLHLAALN